MAIAIDRSRKRDGHDFARDARVADDVVVGRPGVFVGDEAQRGGVEAVALHF